ncbi:MAG: AMP-binding protein [Legionellales bacterium]|nr:AMP-binding protein [Legionellales bacterium]
MTIQLEELLNLNLSTTRARFLLDTVNDLIAQESPIDAWHVVSQSLLSKDDPFAVHELIYQTIYHHDLGCAWRAPSHPNTNLNLMMRQVDVKNYANFHRWSCVNYPQFWDLMVKTLNIKFHEPYTQIVNANTIEEPQWLCDAQFNIAESLFSGDENDTAVICQSEDGKLTRLSYQELDEYSNQIANGLVTQGFKMGDAIAIDMLMDEHAVAIYIGIIKAGCRVVSIADSFAPEEIATRLRIANAKAIFTQDYIQRGNKRLPMYEKVCQAKPAKIIMLGNHELKLRAHDLHFDDFISDKTTFDPIYLPPDHIINILFSSGTTGDPKAIPWTQTTPIKCAVDAFLHLNIQAQDVLAWPTNLGWMMGPWLIFASLINRATIALYRGAPQGEDFGRFVQDNHVTMLGVVPSLVSTWRATQCMEQYDWSSINCFASTGECSNPSDMLYLMHLAGYKPVIEYCGGTEIGGAYLTSTLIENNYPACFTTPTCGLNFVLIDEQGKACQNGEVALIPPSIGLSTQLLNRDHHQTYYENMPKLISGKPLRRHGDHIQRLENGLYRAQGRVDDTMNLGGIKTSSADIERVLNDVAAIQECAAIAVQPPKGGPEYLVIYAVVSERIAKEDLMKLCQHIIKTKLNPLFKIHDVVITNSLPRTASNKILRRVLRDEYNKKH